MLWLEVCPRGDNIVIWPRLRIQSGIHYTAQSTTRSRSTNNLVLLSQWSLLLLPFFVGWLFWDLSIRHFFPTETNRIGNGGPAEEVEMENEKLRGTVACLLLSPVFYLVLVDGSVAQPASSSCRSCNFLFPDRGRRRKRKTFLIIMTVPSWFVSESTAKINVLAFPQNCHDQIPFPQLTQPTPKCRSGKEKDGRLNGWPKLIPRLSFFPSSSSSSLLVLRCPFTMCCRSGRKETNYYYYYLVGFGLWALGRKLLTKVFPSCRGIALDLSNLLIANYKLG